MTNDLTSASDHPSSRQGRGSIVLALDHGQFHLSELSFTYPLKLVAPKPGKCQSVFLLSYGGGLVGGDSIELNVLLEPDAIIALLTQGSTKIFKHRGTPTRQILDVKINHGATCILIPDPVQPFAASSYIQRQTFHLEQSNLILLDWIVSGRPASGECWDMDSFESTNTIFAEKLLLRDSQTLGPYTKSQMREYDCIATLMITGPALQQASTRLLQDFKKLPRIMNRKHKVQQLIHTVTQHRNVTIVKVIGLTSEDVKTFISALVDTCGWRDKYGMDAFRALD